MQFSKHMTKLLRWYVSVCMCNTKYNLFSFSFHSVSSVLYFNYFFLFSGIATTYDATKPICFNRPSNDGIKRGHGERGRDLNSRCRSIDVLIDQSADTQADFGNQLLSVVHSTVERSSFQSYSYFTFNQTFNR